MQKMTLRRGRFARALGMAAVTTALAASAVVTMTEVASAGGPFYVSTTGNDGNNCLSTGTACRTINGVFLKPAFLPGDTINVAAGTYLNERPSITKAVNIVGAGAGSTIINASATPSGLSQTVAVGIPIGAPNQNVTISGVTITGGRGSTFGGGGILISGGNLVINDSTITGNFAHGLGGGAITNVGRAFGGNPIVTLNRVTVSNNSTVGNLPGGAIYTSGPVNINDSTITGNATGAVGAAALGGGIYINKLFGTDTPTVTVNGSNITNNTASFGGGVFAASATTYNQTGGTLNGNTAINGGGLYVVGVGSTVTANTNASATLFQTAVSGNTANGGAVVNGGNGGGILNAGSLSVEQTELIGNKAVASSASSLATGWGGGVFSAPIGTGDKPTNLFKDSSIGGGAINPNAFVGGGIAVAGNVFNAANATVPTMTAQNLSLNGNTASLGGGGAYFGVSANYGGLIINNKATASSGIGGGIWVAKNPASSPNPVVTYEGTMQANQATSGGGIAVGSASTVNVNNSDVSNNTGTFGAGAINAGTLNVFGSSLSLNASAFQGGAVWNGSSVVTDFPVFTVTSSVIDQNSAASAGGGVLVGARSTATITDASILSNTATAGGGLYVAEGGTALIERGRISFNLANGLLGGGVVNSGTTTIQDVNMQGNQAVAGGSNTGLGGAVYNGSNTNGNTASLVIERSAMWENEAATASAVYSRSQGTGAVNKLSIRDTTISSNSTVGGWTALVSFHPMTMVNSTIANNTSPAGFTGGLFIAGGTIGLAGSIISGNSGGNCNAALIDGGHNLTDPGDATCGLPVAQRVDPQIHGLSSIFQTAGHLPKPTSPAINAIAPNTPTGLTDPVSGTPVVLCAGGTDQRGVVRPQGPACDIGAIEVELEAPTVAGPTNPVFVTGAPASYGYTSTGVPAPDLSVVGTLPAGVTFTDNGDGTGTLAGTPTAPGGTYPVTIVGSNGTDPNGTLDVVVQVNQPSSIQGPASDTYLVGVVDSTNFTTTGIPTPTLSTSSPLPAGIAFTDNGDGTGSLSGTAADGSGGVYEIVIDATNGIGDVAHFEFTLTVEEAPELDGPASATYTVGTAGGPTTFTSDGFPDADLSVSGDPLPDGVTFTDHGDGTGTFSGTPAEGEGGEYHVTVTASNGVDPDASADITVTVNEAPSVTGPATVRFVIGAPDTIGYSATGFPEPDLPLSGDALPDGISYTDHGGGAATLEGTAQPGTAGIYHVTITASNGIDPDDTLDVTIEVVEPVEITTTTLPGGSVGTPYVAHVVADGGGIPYAFSLVAGSLPAGLTLATDGTISGTPTGPAATSNFTVQVSDSLDPAQTDTQELSITIARGATQLLVNPAVLKTTGGLIKLTVGQFSARLVGGSPAAGIGGQVVSFRAGSTPLCSGVTAADGTVTCTTSPLSILPVLLAFGVTGTYAGNASWLPSSGSAGLL